MGNSKIRGEGTKDNPYVVKSVEAAERAAQPIWITVTNPTTGQPEQVPGPGMGPQQANEWRQMKLAEDTSAANTKWIDEVVMPRLKNADFAAGQANAMDWDAWGQQNELGKSTSAAMDANLQDQRNTATWTNNQSGNMFGSYQGEMSALNDSDRQGLSRYLSETDPLMQRREAQGWGADIQADPEGLAAQRAALGQLSGMAGGSLDYQASQYSSNPGDVARQQQAYDTFGGIYGGSLDYESQGAQAYADPRTEQGQWDVYGQLQGAANGSLDTVSKAAQAAASAKSVAQHGKAVDDLGGLVNGGEWADSQRDVRDKYKALTTPEVTGQERFIMELARRQREAEAGAARGAIAQDQSMRGVRSGASETADMLASQQQTSQDRVLADLGMQANAVDRSMQALAGYSNATQAGRGSQLQAQGMYVDATGNLRSQEFDEAFKRAAAGDAMAVANADRKLQAMGMSADQINAMREQSFHEAYSRGIAADNAAANNQATRLGGAQGMASQANAIRAANDAVGTFNVGQQNTAKANNQSTRLGAAGMQSDSANQLRTANDAITKFNKEGSQIAQRFQDDYAQRESERVGGLAGDRLTGTQNTNDGIGSRLTNVHDAGQEHLDQGYDRNKDTITATDSTINAKYGIGQDTIGAATNWGENQYRRAMGGLAGGTNAATLGSNITSTNAQGKGKVLENEAARLKEMEALQALDEGGGW